MASLTQTASQVKIGQHGYLAIFDNRKDAIVAPGFKPGTPINIPNFNPIFQSDSGEFTTEFQDGTKHVTFLTNSLGGWKIAGVMFDEDSAQAVAPIRNTTLLFVLVSLIFGFVIGYWIMRSIVRPMRVIVAASRKIGTGDLTQTVDVRSNDELGQFAKSFNEMVGSLRTLIQEIESTSGQLAASSEELSANAEQNSRAVEQITMITQETATGAEKQVRHVVESKNSVEEINRGIRFIAEDFRHAASAAAEASQTAHDGVESIRVATQQMGSIYVASNALADTIKNLKERSKEIGNIVEVITEIADQTNLLALNAAIEAARAGDSGRGFAVVAEEVRKLAEQSAESAKNIARLIESIQEETSRAVSSMEVSMKEFVAGQEMVNQAGTSFERIKESVERVAGQIQDVSTAVEQITAAIGRLENGMNEVAAVTESTAAGMQTIAAATEEQLASMEQITASSESLSQMAEQLQALIRRFSV